MQSSSEFLLNLAACRCRKFFPYANAFSIFENVADGDLGDPPSRLLFEDGSFACAAFSGHHLFLYLCIRSRRLQLLCTRLWLRFSVTFIRRPQISHFLMV